MTNLGRAWPPGDEYPKEAQVGDVFVHSRDGAMVLGEKGWVSLVEERKPTSTPPANHAERMREWRRRKKDGDYWHVAAELIRYIDEELVPVGAPLEERPWVEKKLSDVIDEFRTNISHIVDLDERLNYSRMERQMHVQAVYLRAAVQLFHRLDKAAFARAAKIAWDTMHGREKL